MSRGNAKRSTAKAAALRAMLVTAWLSVLLPVLAALPVQAVAASPGADAFGRVDVYICTAQPDAPTAPAQAEGPHCPLCVMHGGTGVILPSDASGAVSPTTKAVRAFTPYRAARIHPAHPAPPPPLRGPPHFV